MPKQCVFFSIKQHGMCVSLGKIFDENNVLSQFLSMKFLKLDVHFLFFFCEYHGWFSLLCSQFRLYSNFNIFTVYFYFSVQWEILRTQTMAFFFHTLSTLCSFFFLFVDYCCCCCCLSFVPNMISLRSLKFYCASFIPHCVCVCSFRSHSRLILQ